MYGSWVRKFQREPCTDLCTPYTTTHSQTALHVCASFGWLSAVEALVHNGVEIQQRDHSGRGAIDHASGAGHAYIASFLQMIAGQRVAETAKVRSTLARVCLCCCCMIDA